MSEELKSAIFIGVECMAFALLILIISVFGRFSYEALHMKHNQDITKSDIAEYREMFEFSMGREIVLSELGSKGFGTNYKNYTPITIETMEGSAKFNRKVSVTMKPDDVVRFIDKNKSKYDIYINDAGVKYEFKKSLENFDTLSELNNLFSGSIDEDFECLVVYDSDKYEYDAVVFVR